MVPRPVPRRIAACLLAAVAVVAAAGCTAGGRSTPAAWHTPAADVPAAGGTGGAQPIVDSTGEGVALSGTASPGAVLTNTGSAAVALTFDDGPSPAHTPQILALLREYHVTATFCVVGVHVQAHPDLVRAIVRDGHTLCNHTWNHDMNLGNRSADAIRADLRRTSDEIGRAAPGAPIKYFRHPGGNFTPAAVAVARDLGMSSIGWDVDPRDWDAYTGGNGPAMTEHIVAVVKQYTRTGSIVLSHDGGGDRTCTMAAYRTLLPYLTERFTLTGLPV